MSSSSSARLHLIKRTLENTGFATSILLALCLSTWDTFMNYLLQKHHVMHRNKWVSANRKIQLHTQFNPPLLLLFLSEPIKQQQFSAVTLLSLGLSNQEVSLWSLFSIKAWWALICILLPRRFALSNFMLLHYPNHFGSFAQLLVEPRHVGLGQQRIGI